MGWVRAVKPSRPRSPPSRAAHLHLLPRAFSLAAAMASSCSALIPGVSRAREAATSPHLLPASRSEAKGLTRPQAAAAPGMTPIHRRWEEGSSSRSRRWCWRMRGTCAALASSSGRLSLGLPISSEPPPSESFPAIRGAPIPSRAGFQLQGRRESTMDRSM